MSTINSDNQPFKYNGKEFDKMYGLNTFDYGGRQYNSIVPTWDRIDPLAEKHYNVSPYAYCSDNPINAIDPDGKDSYYTLQGNYIGTNFATTSNIYILQGYQVVKNLGDNKELISYSTKQNIMDCDLTAEAYSNLATNELVRHGFDVSKLINGKISVNILNVNGTGQLEWSCVQSYNTLDPNLDNLSYDVSQGDTGPAYVVTNHVDNNKFSITINVYPNDLKYDRSILSTESNFINIIGIHEFNDHGLKKLQNNSHWKILQDQMKDPSWMTVTPNFKDLYKNLIQYRNDYKPQN